MQIFQTHKTASEVCNTENPNSLSSVNWSTKA